MSPQRELDPLAIDTLRALTMDAVEAANSGHPGAAMALAPLGWVLFSRVMHHAPTHPEWQNRDRFILSCGHASMLLYGLLHASGYDLSLDDLRRFRQWGSKTPGHPEYRHTPGVETTTGPLGQGVANAVGMAMAETHLAARFNRDGHSLFDHRVYVIASDGDLMEGVAAEAASLAGHLRLGKLIVFWDDNEITIDGRTEIAFSEDLLARFAAYGWHTQSVAEGNDLEALERATRLAEADPRPSLIRVRTLIAYPSPNKQNTSSAHGSPLGGDEVKRTKEAMGWEHPPFTFPQALESARKAIVAAGEAQVKAWNERWQAYQKAFPAEAAELEALWAGRLPSDWQQGLPEFKVDPKGVATRKASGDVLSALAQNIPQLVGGSADLAASNNSYLKGFADFAAELKGVPRNVHWGIREHAMGSAANGMALHGGVLPYVATFLIFSDYMRPAIRLACLMNLPVRYIFTHDSIGLGEDGPTHQPVEQLASLRAIPNMTVFRPADANEVRECWKTAMSLPGPVAMVLTRQNLPVVEREAYAAVENVARGAYVLREASRGQGEVLLLATGSEVAIALEAREQLEAKGLPTRVVSMPSWELFAKQDQAYRDSILPPAIERRVVIEAATRMGWERWGGNRGIYITLDHFGASAPYTTLYREFGLSAERVVEAVLADR